jgi:FlaA1/EpsC-like NDP-sugar epimerase
MSDSPGARLPARSILVTGAGGFIGSALANSLASGQPDRIILLDCSEDSLPARQFPHEAVTGCVADAGLLDETFRRFRPQIVYHAAALKHVPELEFDPFSAVLTNALGTYRLAQTALRHGVRRLVLVSTDKAVNPHSIMGASKRLAELVVATLGTRECRMNAVRLGNVIGSTGSVVPIFQDQIKRREPVTVTDPEATRYFISLDDAVEAILAAGEAECSGRILLPDLGAPERITDLARRLIRKAANGAGNEIAIRYIGLRPGEKLTEDLAYASEAREGRVLDKLDVIRTVTPSPEELHERIERLACLLASGDLQSLIETISSLVPEYRPSPIILESMGASK